MPTKAEVLSAGSVLDDKLKAVRAVYDILGGDRNESGDLVDAIPSRCFGKQKARILRKLILVAIAKNANADGSKAWPSLETIARRCLVTTRAVQRTIRWLVKHRLLKVQSKGAPTSKFGRTNLYTILFPKPKEGFEAPGNESSKCSSKHLEQWNGAPGNESSNDRPLERPRGLLRNKNTTGRTTPRECV